MPIFILLFFLLLACTPSGPELVSESHASVFGDSTEEAIIDKGVCVNTNCVDGDAKLVFKSDATYSLTVKHKNIRDIDFTETDFPTVTKIFLHSNAENYFISYELTNQNLTTSRVKAISKKTADIVWEVGIPGGNLSTPLKLEERLYIATADMLAKIDTSSGALDWKQSTPSLVKDVVGTALIELKEDVVEFQTESATIKISDENGKIL